MTARPVWAVGLVAAFSLADVEAVSGQVQQTRALNAAPGQNLLLGFYHSLDSACQSLGEPTVRVVRNPASGRLQIRKTRSTANYPAGHNLTKCNQYTVPGIRISYRAGRSPAVDEFSILINWVDGETWNQTIRVNVQ